VIEEEYFEWIALVDAVLDRNASSSSSSSSSLTRPFVVAEFGARCVRESKGE
jgi:hypothetical protein